MVPLYEATTLVPKIISIFFFEGCAFHFFLILLVVSLSGPFATVKSREIEVCERSVRDSVLSCVCLFWGLELLTCFSEADKFSRSSQSAIASHLTILLRHVKHKPMNTPGSIFLPN